MGLTDPADALGRRVLGRYPVRADKAIGRGTTPTLRLQGTLGTRGSFRAWEKVLVWSHWLWFLFPDGTVAYLLLRRPEHFPRGAAQIYATFDLGLIGYWAVPTAPPWYAAAQGLMADGRTPELRRMMVEYGEQFWKSGWAPLYGFLGGNPLAAMPSLHFATSVTAAHVLTDSRAAAAPLAWVYAGTLGLALVYLGVHIFDNVDLEALAEAAAARKRWEFMLTVAPLAIRGGTGSPAPCRPARPADRSPRPPPRPRGSRCRPRRPAPRRPSRTASW